MWVEQKRTTSALVILPQTCYALYHGLSKFYLSFLSKLKYRTLHITHLVSPPPLAYTRLPIPTRCGIKHRLRRCAGCYLSISGKVPTASSCFQQARFDGSIPRGTIYYVGYIRAGLPFHSRCKNNHGLAFPTVRFWANFIYKACTVLSITHREILSRKDLYLLKLERMRLIDMSWHWSSGTNTQYQSKINTIRTFEEQFTISMLPVPCLVSSPSSADIPLMWCREAQSTRQGAKEKHISHNIVCQLRSAAGQFSQWSALVFHP